MASTRPKLKILMLHGFTNTGAIFHSKTRALEKAIHKAFPSSTMHYLDGPHRLKPSDIPTYNNEARDPRSLESDTTEIESFAWWKRKDPPASASGSPVVVYAGIEVAFSAIAAAIRTHGPFDGVIGFSQGACAAAIVASLLEGQSRKAVVQEWATKGREERLKWPKEFDGEAEMGTFVQPPLKFAVMYSGFAAPGEVFHALYTPKITTRSLHVIGTLDTIVEMDRSSALANSFDEPRTFSHPGGHFCPSTKDALEAVVGFIKDSVLGSQDMVGPARGLDDQRAEDMDVPF